MTAHDDDESVIRRERFSGGPAREFLSSLAADERIFAADLAVDQAHVVMLTEQGIISEEDAGAILSALADVESAGHEALADGEDVHEAIETAVIDRVGPAGGRMHTARSRNDEVAACLRYRLREDILTTVETVLAARGAFLDVAAEHSETIMPGYTHLQPAQPTTVAHWLCSYESALARDTERLLSAYERINQSPLGGAAFAGTPFDIDRERTAELLGFDGLVENAIDAAPHVISWSRRLLRPQRWRRRCRDSPRTSSSSPTVGISTSPTSTPRRRASCPRRKTRTRSNSCGDGPAIRLALSTAC